MFSVDWFLLNFLSDFANFISLIQSMSRRVQISSFSETTWLLGNTDHKSSKKIEKPLATHSTSWTQKPEECNIRQWVLRQCRHFRWRSQQWIPSWRGWWVWVRFSSFCLFPPFWSTWIWRTIWRTRRVLPMQHSWIRGRLPIWRQKLLNFWIVPTFCWLRFRFRFLFSRMGTFTRASFYLFICDHYTNR